jgi:hypothetical protein
MVQLVLCGALLPVAGRPGLEQLGYLVPARYGFAMAASTVNLQHLNPSLHDNLWFPTLLHWTADVGALAALSAVVIVATRMLLRRQEPRRR